MRFPILEQYDHSSIAMKILMACKITEQYKHIMMKAERAKIGQDPDTGYFTYKSRTAELQSLYIGFIRTANLFKEQIQKLLGTEMSQIKDLIEELSRISGKNYLWLTQLIGMDPEWYLSPNTACTEEQKALILQYRENRNNDEFRSSSLL